MTDLPTFCHRCGKFILDAQATEMVPLIPRWGMSIMVHESCEPRILPLWSTDLRSEISDRPGRPE